MMTPSARTFPCFRLLVLLIAASGCVLIGCRKEGPAVRSPDGRAVAIIDWGSPTFATDTRYTSVYIKSGLLNRRHLLFGGGIMESIYLWLGPTIEIWSLLVSVAPV